MIEVLTVLCMYPAVFGDGSSGYVPLLGTMVTQTRIMVTDKPAYAGWRVDFTDSLRQAQLLQYNQGVVVVNENLCLVKESRKL